VSSPEISLSRCFGFYRHELTALTAILPRFYDSIHQPTPYKTGRQSTDPSIPKILVLSGSSVQHDNADDGQELFAEGSPSSRSRFSTPGGSILQDVADEIGVPTKWELTDSPRAGSGSVSNTTGMPSSEEKEYSRKLDEDESRGLWVLAGLLASSWLLGKVVNRTLRK